MQDENIIRDTLDKIGDLLACLRTKRPLIEQHLSCTDVALLYTHRKQLGRYAADDNDREENMGEFFLTVQRMCTSILEIQDILQRACRLNIRDISTQCTRAREAVDRRTRAMTFTPKSIMKIQHAFLRETVATVHQELAYIQQEDDSSSTTPTLQSKTPKSSPNPPREKKH